MRCWLTTPSTIPASRAVYDKSRDWFHFGDDADGAEPAQDEDTGSAAGARKP